MNKAMIIDFDEYLSYMKDKIPSVMEEFGNMEEPKKQYLPGRGYENTVFGDLCDAINRFSEDKAVLVQDYITANGFQYTEGAHCCGWCLLHYSGCVFPVPEQMVRILPQKDYSEIPAFNLLPEGQEAVNISTLPAELQGYHLNGLKKEEDSLTKSIEGVRLEMKKVEKAEEGELARLREEIERRKAELEARKKVLLDQLEEKKRTLEEKKAQMEKEIYILSAEIYSIRCFTGEVVELAKIREGRKCADQVPVVLNQKMLYLDEDLARLSSIYAEDIDSQYHMLEEVLKYNEEAMEAFCPQEKCISFFRLSRKAEIKNYEYIEVNNVRFGFWNRYKLLHGKKIGFAIRNGEQLYAGWMEDTWDTGDAISFQEEVMYRPQKQVEAMEEERHKGQSGKDEMVSRLFAANVVQGIIAEEHILGIPKDCSVLTPSQYIVHNYADAWLMDDRYGDFKTFMDNLHYFSKEGDPIIIIQSLTETEDTRGGGSRGRSDSYANRTHDCEVADGLNSINYIDRRGNIYVSALKTCSGAGARSNFMIEKGEYFNIAFCCSTWLQYYISTKKLGRIHMEYNYAIRYLKKALDFIKAREVQEKEALLKYTDTLPDNWPELLTYWKIQNHVRKITEYQAKRAAKYFARGDCYEMPQLFSVCPNFSLDLKERYAFPQIDDLVFGTRRCGEGDQDFGWNTDYADRWYHSAGKYAFRIGKYYTASTAEEIAEGHKQNLVKLKRMFAELQAVMDKNLISRDEIIRWEKAVLSDWKKSRVGSYSFRQMCSRRQLLSRLLEEGLFEYGDLDPEGEEYVKKEAHGVDVALMILCCDNILHM